MSWKRIKTKQPTYCENSDMSWSFSTLSGRFCKKRILLGGRYSSGIWTAGRFGPGAATPPSTAKRWIRTRDSRDRSRHTGRCQLLCSCFPFQRIVNPTFSLSKQSVANRIQQKIKSHFSFLIAPCDARHTGQG